MGVGYGGMNGVFYTAWEHKLPTLVQHLLASSLDNLQSQ